MLHLAEPKGQAPREIFITDQLDLRPARTPDYQREKSALQELSSQLLSPEADLLPRFVELAMELTGGVASGLSIFEEAEGDGVFRWRHLHGSLAAFENATTPRHFSPCGITLDENRPVLTRHAERFYTWISDAKIVVPEVLLVPLRVADGEPVGTLWIVSDKENYFDANDARVAAELAGFVGVALHLGKTRALQQEMLDQQETLTKEMSHRVKNLFAVAEGLVRVSAKTTDTKEEMAETLIGRFHALAGAHSLIRRSFSAEPSGARVSDFSSLLHTIVKPHERKSGPARFVIDGPAIALGEHAINGLALVFHELATNAAKYGALKSENGKIDILWDVAGDDLRIAWTERGGPSFTAPPVSEGFGNKLLNDTVKRQFSGTLENHWESNGLKVAVCIPMKRLAD